MTPEEFRQRLLSDSPETILTEVLLSDEAKHVTIDQRRFIKQRLSDQFNVPIDTINLIIVGSAKLGFSIFEKKNKIDKSILPRYRSFNPQSDVDLAIICKPIGCSQCLLSIPKITSLMIMRDTAIHKF